MRRDLPEVQIDEERDGDSGHDLIVRVARRDREVLIDERQLKIIPSFAGITMWRHIIRVGETEIFIKAVLQREKLASIAEVLKPVKRRRP